MPLLPCERSGMATVDHPTFPLFEVDPQPQLYADIVGIEVVALVGEEVVSREGQKDIRINRKVVLHKPFETNPWPEDEGRIIFAEAGFDKLRPKVRPSVGDRPALQERQGGDVEFRKGPEPVARELIKILIIPNWQISPKILKLLKMRYENASSSSLANRVPDSGYA
jgi:hypothetical protein